MKQAPSLGQEFRDAGLGTSDDGLLSLHEDGALEELLVLEEDLDHGLRVAGEVVALPDGSPQGSRFPTASAKGNDAQPE